MYSQKIPEIAVSLAKMKKKKQIRMRLVNLKQRPSFCLSGKVQKFFKVSPAFYSDTS